MKDCCSVTCVRDGSSRVDRAFASVVALVATALCVLIAAAPADARKPPRERVFIDIERSGSDETVRGGMFGTAFAGTTWIGWVPGAYDPVTNPYSIGVGGYWDFDDRGTHACPVEDDYHEYIKNGAYAQGWTSEDVIAQKGLYWHAEDFSDAGFTCQGNAAINGTYSAWCGALVPDVYSCYKALPGYGHDWNQWLCRTVANPTGLRYTFKSDTEPGFDYAYVIVDAEYPDSCGWVGDGADTLRCYDGIYGQTTETIDLTDLPGTDPDFCSKETYTTPDYSLDTVKICFVVTSDTGWDDQDGNFATCDGAMTLDDIIVTTTSFADTTDFESGALDGWTACGGYSPGDYVAVRSRDSFNNNDDCGFQGCDMAGCVMTFYNPNIPGQYGNGGHYAGLFHKRAWSPPIGLDAYPSRGYLINLTRYEDLPISNWIFGRYYVRYKQDSECPTGVWSDPYSDNYIYPYAYPGCGNRSWGFSYAVPSDADSVMIGYSVWNGCISWDTPCTNGNDSPVIDNVRLGIFDLSVPRSRMKPVDNYTDAFPEDEDLGDYPSTKTALIDIATNLSQTGAFMRLGDSAIVRLDEPDAQVDFCFRVVPGPGTDTNDPWFARYGEGGMAGCDTTEMHCTRMDTCFYAGNGVPGSPYEYQKISEGSFCTMIHEDDPLYTGEGEEILPDSLFTPGSTIFYAFRMSYIPDPAEYAWLPFGADPTGTDLSTWYEVSVLPDQCKDPEACLLYVDYFNRGAQATIENALSMLGHTWDRFDMTAEASHQGNGIGNRLLGPGKYRLSRGPIGPSLDHLSQYNVMMINNGAFGDGTNFSDGGTGTPDDPTNDVVFLDNWLSEGRAKGLWLSGNNIASDFAWATSGPKPGFLNRELATDLVSNEYVYLVGHPFAEGCRNLFATGGKVNNWYSSTDSLSLWGSGCPDYYAYDVIQERDSESGHAFVSLMYDDTDVTYPPGYYASVDHVYKAPSAPFDTVRTKIDGFTMNTLRMNHPPCSGVDNIMVAVWMRDVLGSANNRGYFYDNELDVAYCPATGPDLLTDVPGGPGRKYYNALFQNYPNPFRGGAGTTIHYSVTKAGPVQVRVFDPAGRLVRTLVDNAERGDNFLLWDGTGSNGRAAASGVYFYQIVADGFAAHKKMLLLR
jgi:hypothetical protein